MLVETIPGIQQLSIQEKLLLASELWEQIAEADTEIPITRAQMDELDRRHQYYLEHPEYVTTLEEITSRILAKKKDHQ